jgi:propionyl-CoA carboxylase alpha chain
MGEEPTFSKVLVANRGEIARRVFATCRRMGIATVAVYSEPDREAPFVAEADEAVPLGGVTAADSYLQVERLMEAAGSCGADAIHPGYGFLAESAELARAVVTAGLVWIGPPAAAIEAMGSKVRARAMMEEAGVPVLPGAELGSGSDLDSEGARVGFPLLVKASAGGGGKGMRTVADPAGLAAAVEGAGREAQSAFGDGTVFLERFLERPRHVEIQVLADRHGHTVSLGERECSIQRRHQKVIEEAPSPAVDAELRHRMGDAAVAAAEAVSYEGAGTVEFLLGPDGEFFFLEMNTRLQVEHPVTELVTGLDLVRLQLLVAAGEELPAAVHEVELRGHAIEARLYAEDAANDFLPQTGTVTAIAVEGAEPFAPAPDRGAAGSVLRIDSGVESGSLVSPHYDPMLAKVIAWAPSRSEAAGRLASALRSAPLHGPTTNRDLLVRTLTHAAFAVGQTDTGFIERHPELAEPLVDAPGTRLHALAAALAGMLERHHERGRRGILGFVPPGFRNNPSSPQSVAFAAGGERIEVGYRLGRDGIEAEVGGTEIAGLHLHDGSHPGELDLEAEGVRRRYLVARDGDTHWVNSPLGQSGLRELPRYPGAEESEAEGALVAPMPGRVIKLAVGEGDDVEAGQVIAVLEAMKMEHELTAPAAGALAELRVAVGDQVDSGAIVGVIEAAG